MPSRRFVGRGVYLVVAVALIAGCRGGASATADACPERSRRVPGSAGNALAGATHASPLPAAAADASIAAYAARGEAAGAASLHLVGMPGAAVVIVAAEADEHRQAAVTYDLFAFDGRRVTVRLEYFQDGEWHPASGAADQRQTLARRPARPEGARHRFVWDAATDLGRDFRGTARLRAYPAGDPDDGTEIAVAFGALPTFGPPPPPAPVRAPRLETPAPVRWRVAADTVFAPCWPGELVAADWSGDGRADLAFTNQHVFTHEQGYRYGRFYVLAGRGDGTFEGDAERSWYGAGLVPKGLHAADFTGDGRPDLVTTDFYGESVTLYHNDGQGRLVHAFTYDSVPAAKKRKDVLGRATAYNPYAAFAADWNGDGRLDLAVVNNTDDRRTDNNLAIFLNDGAGRFYQEPWLFDSTNYFLSSVQGGDFNGDGLWDLALGNYGDLGQLSICLGTGDGKFAKGVISTGQDMGMRRNKPVALRVGDYNRDGVWDISAAGHSGGLYVYLGKAGAGGAGDGTFAPGVRSDGEIAQSTGIYLAQADFNGDGCLDLAVTHQSTEYFSVWFGRGDGTFKNYDSPSMPDNFVGQSLVAADWNGDGRPDLALTTVQLRDPDRPVCRLRILLNEGAAPGGAR